jgi:hypothetical protein
MPSRTESLLNRELDSDSVDSEDEETDGLPDGQAGGLNYHPKRILVEGHLHKLGTGKDWIGSRSWKPRWARLVVSKTIGNWHSLALFIVFIMFF